MTHVCPKCGAVIVVETDDRKHAEKRIEKLSVGKPTATPLKDGITWKKKYI